MTTELADACTSSADRARRLDRGFADFSRPRSCSVAPSALAWLRSPGGWGLGMGPGPSPAVVVENGAASRCKARPAADQGAVEEAGVAGYPVSDGGAEDLERRTSRPATSRTRSRRSPPGSRGRALPDAARRDRHRQDGDDGVDHRADRSGPRS